MPRGDRTGPNGMGPMTGRAAGFCAGYDEAGFAFAPGGFGRGRAHGRGLGRPRGRFGAGTAYGGRFRFGQNEIRAEIEALERRIDYLKREMDVLDAEQGTGEE